MKKETKDLLMIGGVGLAGVIGLSMLSRPQEEGFTFSGGSGGGGGADVPGTKLIDSGGSIVHYHFPDIPQPDLGVTGLSKKEDAIDRGWHEISEGDIPYRPSPSRPDYERPFIIPTKKGDTIAQRRGGIGHDFARAESIPYGPGRVPKTKKEERMTYHQRLLQGQRIIAGKVWDRAKGTFFSPIALYMTYAKNMGLW